jgi:hypothetical protein
VSRAVLFHSIQLLGFYLPLSRRLSDDVIVHSKSQYDIFVRDPTTSSASDQPDHAEFTINITLNTSIGGLFSVVRIFHTYLNMQNYFKNMKNEMVKGYGYRARNMHIKETTHIHEHGKVMKTTVFLEYCGHTKYFSIFSSEHNITYEHENKHKSKIEVKKLFT